MLASSMPPMAITATLSNCRRPPILVKYDDQQSDTKAKFCGAFRAIAAAAMFAELFMAASVTNRCGYHIVS